MPTAHTRSVAPTAPAMARSMSWASTLNGLSKGADQHDEAASGDVHSTPFRPQRAPRARTPSSHLLQRGCAPASHVTKPSFDCILTVIQVNHSERLRAAPHRESMKGPAPRGYLPTTEKQETPR